MQYGKPLSLKSIPDDFWQNYKDLGFDFIWLMGIWQRSKRSREINLSDTNLRKFLSEVLSDFIDEDIIGSPYSIYSYNVDANLGKNSDLIDLKERLNHIGIGLILDFVPNHVGLDHPWVARHPEWFVKGEPTALKKHPEWFFKSDSGEYLAYGRDPNFPPWTDTAQINYFSYELRLAVIKELNHIAQFCNGVRCDMAMLGLNSVFKKVWGEWQPSLQPLNTEYWQDVIQNIKKIHPDFLFIAEVYWGLEKELLELGFDYAYDKVLYDRLKYDSPLQIQSYLKEHPDRHAHCVHFVENHDEQRAVNFYGEERSLAGATAICTIPGLRLFYDGQIEGHAIHMPLQVRRAAQEKADSQIKNYYETLLKACQSDTIRLGDWSPLDCGPAYSGDTSYINLLTWCWNYREQVEIVVINYSDIMCTGRVKLPVALDNRSLVKCFDTLNNCTYTSSAVEVKEQGLYIRLEPWKSHILKIETI